MSALLRIENLRVEFPGATAVEDVALDLHENEVLAVVGESGSGKSVTALAVLGLLPPAAAATGSITLDGREVLGLVGESGSGKTTLGRVAVGRLRASGGAARLFGTDLAGLGRAELRALRRRIGVVHQDPAASLDPRRTVLESITEPLDVHRVGTRAARTARAEDLLDQVRLTRDHGARLPRELSGGQRQRVALARALVLEPELLVADEPPTPPPSPRLTTPHPARRPPNRTSAGDPSLSYICELTA